MSIARKIEQIRKKPDHIKLRYIWACVGVSMLIIFPIWVVYITYLLRADEAVPATNQESSVESLKNQLQNVKAPTPTKGRNGEQEQISAEGVNNTNQKTTDFQYPINNSEEVTPSANYKDLKDNSAQ